MNRRTRTLVVIGVAVLLASLASYGVYRAVQRIPVREVTVVERQQVVAKEHIPVGVLVTKEQVKLVPWPASAPVMGGFTSIEEVVGRGVTAPFVENEAIIEPKLAARDSGGGLPPRIPEGMRAMSVRVNEIIGVAGYTTPGTRVDVVVTTTRSNEPISKTVLSNIQVLAAGTKYEEDLARKEPIRTTVVTLLLTPQDAERLTLATNQGSIALALRNPLDTVPTDTNGVRMAGLLANTNAPPVRVVTGNRTRIVTPDPPAPPKPYTVEMIEGTSRKQEILKCTPPCGSGGK
jgi:pilus assembly protein CpaB